MHHATSLTKWSLELFSEYVLKERFKSMLQHDLFLLKNYENHLGAGGDLYYLQWLDLTLTSY